MRIAWLTDIHLDHATPAAFEALCDEVEATGASHVLIGGDIAEAPSVGWWLQQLAARLQRPIFFVLGNHDYYKGSIPEVRKAIAETAAEDPWLCWLPGSEVVLLAPKVALVGHGGWGDARAPDFATSRVGLNDYVWIKELSGLWGEELALRLRALGDDAAATLEQQLRAALGMAERVIVLTHVPPFVGACWHEGVISDAQWAPHFTCVAMGELLLRVAAEHPDRQITVLCGHTHGRGWFEAAPNLEVWTGEATYGAPEVQRGWGASGGRGKPPWT